MVTGIEILIDRYFTKSFADCAEGPLEPSILIGFPTTIPFILFSAIISLISKIKLELFFESSSKEVLDEIMMSIAVSGYKPGEQISLALDAASTEFFKDDKYIIEGNALSNTEMSDYLIELSNSIKELTNL